LLVQAPSCVSSPAAAVSWGAWLVVAKGNLASDGFESEMPVWFRSSSGDQFQLKICLSIDLVYWILK